MLYDYINLTLRHSNEQAHDGIINNNNYIIIYNNGIIIHAHTHNADLHAYMLYHIPD